MGNFSTNKIQLNSNGFTIIERLYSTGDIAQMQAKINNADSTKPAFRKTSELFAIRQFLKEVPEIVPIIFNDKLKSVIAELFGTDYFVVKSIYFDKPEQSNWFVSYHQDLTISVDKKIDVPGYTSWTIKQNQFAVQPPVSLSENIFTIRIHLDDTDENNGALKVVPKSHLTGIYRPENIDWEMEKEIICKVKSGGIMATQPLLLHSSSRTINNNKRRVIHIEFSNDELPKGINWAERMKID